MGIQIKKFQASTLQAAIEQVRSEMGDNAIILQTEAVKLSGPLGLGKNGVEITAAIDRKEESAKFHATVTSAEGPSPKKGLFGKMAFTKKATVVAPAPLPVTTAVAKIPTTALRPAALSADKPPAGLSASVGQLYAMKTYIEPLQKEVELLKSKMAGGSNPHPTKKRIKDPLEAEVQRLRAEFAAFVNEQRYQDNGLPNYFRELVEFWNSKGMSDNQIHSFFREIEKTGVRIEGQLTDAVAASHLETALDKNILEANILSDNKPKIVVLVGPTGVGKTTTIAKMAAYEKLRLSKTVSFISIDDFKIGGTDQMANYARILDVPFMKSRSDMSLEEQCKMFQSDAIYIDTFGLSPFDEDKMKSLEDLLNFQDPELASRLEVHLVLPVGVSPRDTEMQLKRYESLKPKYLLFTKWDETANWGGMLSAILTAKKPVSFVCHSQSVPDDFSIFSKKEFIQIVTEGIAETLGG